MKHSKFDKIFQKSSKTPLQRRGEKNLGKPQKLKKIRLKLLKCEKAENEFKIFGRKSKSNSSKQNQSLYHGGRGEEAKKAT